MALTTSPIASLQAKDYSTLSRGIAAADTTIYANAQKKWVSGVETTGGFDTSAGFCMITDGTGRFEYMSYDSKSVNATTFETTFSNCRRGLSPTSAGFAAGTGMAWDAGSSIFVVDYPAIWQNLMTKDTTQTVSGTKTFDDFNVTTYTNATEPVSPSNARMWYNSDTGTFRGRAAGATFSFGTATVSNAADGTSGKVDIATVAEIAAGTANDASSGAPNALTVGVTKQSSSGAAQGNIPALNASAAVARDIGGLGTTSGTAYTLLANGTSSTGATQSLASVGTAGQELLSNGAGALPTFQNPYTRHLGTITAAAASVGGGNTTENTISPTWTGTDTIPASALAAGSEVEINLGGKCRIVDVGSGGMEVNVYLGSKLVGGFYVASTAGANSDWCAKIHVSIRTGGATGTFYAQGIGNFMLSSTTSYASNLLSDAGAGTVQAEQTAVDFTGTLQLIVKAQFNTSNASHACNIQSGSLVIRKYV